jgi:mono/diheme cytochrome c family protein
MKDANPNVRIAAIRVTESLIKNGDKSLIADIQSLAKDADPNVVLQTILTAKLLNWPDASKFMQLTMITVQAKGVKQIAGQLLNSGNELDVRQFNGQEVALLRKGEAIYQELCFACHGYAGTGMPQDGAPPGTTIGPPLAGSREVLDHRESIIRVLLAGATGPVEGKTYTAEMVPMDSNDDEWIAAVSSYVRNSFGNHGAVIMPKDVVKLRAEAKSRTSRWTVEELRAQFPVPVNSPKEWKITASHNPQDAKNAADDKQATRWYTKADQEPGMWVQVELPQETEIGGVWIDTGKAVKDYPRGYKVETSIDGQKWGKPVAEGKGNPGTFEVAFAPVKAKFVRITQTGKLKGNEKNVNWAITELRVLKPMAH